MTEGCVKSFFVFAVLQMHKPHQLLCMMVTEVRLHPSKCQIVTMLCLKRNTSTYLIADRGESIRQFLWFCIPARAGMLTPL